MSGVTFKRNPIPEILEEGTVVRTRLAGIEPHSFQWEGKTINKLRWLFTVTEEDNPWFSRDLRGETPDSFDPHPSCKAYHWVKAITGKAFDVDDPELPADQLIGLPCRVLIEHQEGKDGRIWMRVRDVFPSSKASREAIEPAENPF